MKNVEILKIELIGIADCIERYTSSPFIRNIVAALRNSLETLDYDALYYCCGKVSEWYVNNFDEITNAKFVRNKEEHTNNCILIKQILDDLKDNENEYRQLFATLSTTAPTSHNLTESTLKLLIDKFDEVVVQLRDRHNNRETLDVSDEYDVQDLLRSLLYIYCDDIRTEEWTPSYAGTSSRQDFLLKKEKIVIETKKTRKGLGNKELANELIIDIKRYKAHQDCNELVCFVYDPERRIKNPRGFESDLSNDKEQPKVKVYIRP